MALCLTRLLTKPHQVRPGSKVLDVGCGVGGPMRNIAVFGDCSVQGITINQYQVRHPQRLYLRSETTGAQLR